MSPAIFRAARTARSASSSCAVGAPNRASTPSPARSLMVPPNASTAPTTRATASPTMSLTSSGSRRSPSAVEPTRSANNAVTTFRSSRRPCSSTGLLWPHGAPDRFEGGGTVARDRREGGVVDVEDRWTGPGVGPRDRGWSGRVAQPSMEAGPADHRPAVDRARDHHGASAQVVPAASGHLSYPRGYNSPFARAAVGSDQMRIRYSRWDGTQDPLGPDISAADLLEEMSGELLSGQGADAALQRM